MNIIKVFLKEPFYKFYRCYYTYKHDSFIYFCYADETVRTLDELLNKQYNAVVV